MQGRLVSERGAGGVGSDVQLFERWESDLVKKSPELERPVLTVSRAWAVRSRSVWSMDRPTLPPMLAPITAIFAGSAPASASAPARRGR